MLTCEQRVRQRVTPTGARGADWTRVAGGINQPAGIMAQCRLGTWDIRPRRDAVLTPGSLTANLVPPPPPQGALEESAARKEPLFSRFLSSLLCLLHVTVFHSEETAEPLKALHNPSLPTGPASPHTHLVSRAPLGWMPSAPRPQPAPPAELLQPGFPAQCP